MDRNLKALYWRIVEALASIMAEDPQRDDSDPIVGELLNAIHMLRDEPNIRV